jgi:hypothetical protein
MGPQGIEILTTAVAPIVMVSAAGLLFNGVQAKNLHLSDRIRGLMVEFRGSATTADRRQQVIAQLAYFDRRMRLSQHALELIYAAILCFVLTSLLLASVLWAGPPVLPVIITTIFVAGVALLIGALGLEFVEMWLSLRTIEIEMTGLPGSRRAEEPSATDGSSR